MIGIGAGPEEAPWWSWFLQSGGAVVGSAAFAAVLEAEPAMNSPGTGNALVAWNTLTNQMTVNVAFSGLTSGTTASHIHCCAPPPANTGVATTVPTFPGFPLGVTSGTYSRTFDMTSAGSYNPAFVTANGGTPASAEAALFAGLVAGQAYLNIHTTMFPGGEIRGFLEQP